MAKKKVLRKKTTFGVKKSGKMSPVVQFAVVFIIVAAMFLLYYVGTMAK